MPKITLHIPIKDIEPVVKGIEHHARWREGQRVDSPYIDAYETKLFWDGWDADKYGDPIFVKEEFGDEIEIFNGHYITFKNK